LHCLEYGVILDMTRVRDASVLHCEVIIYRHFQVTRNRNSCTTSLESDAYPVSEAKAVKHNIHLEIP